MAEIIINGISFDPESPPPPPQTALPKDYIVVQTKRPLTPADAAALADHGAEILEDVQWDGLICLAPGADLALIEGLDFVEHAFLYPEVAKIAPSLLGIQSQSGGIDASIARAAWAAKLDDSEQDVVVVLHRKADIGRAAVRIAAGAGIVLRDSQIGRGKVYMTVTLNRLTAVVEVDEVRHIDRVFPVELMNNVARGILMMPGGDPPPGSGGEGEIVAVADTGFDMGSITNVHTAFDQRVLKLYALGRPGTDGDFLDDQDDCQPDGVKAVRDPPNADDPHGHGTHVAGSVLGADASAIGGPMYGTAPNAKLVLQSLFANRELPLRGLPQDLEDLFWPPYECDGARIHTNSWGDRDPLNYGRYSERSFEIDDFVYKHRDLLVCVAAGNGGADCNDDGRIDSYSISPPGTARNCITVGASESYRPEMTRTWGNDSKDLDKFGTPPIVDDKVADNIEGMAAFSGRGPTQDQRLKPDIVAPGTYILSARSRITATERWGITHKGVYMFDAGTSMATPLVAGCAANVRSFLRTDLARPTPSAALVKASLINGARRLTGQYQDPFNDHGGTIPNNNQGFGLVNVAAIVATDPALERLLLFDEDETPLLTTTEQQAYEVPLPEGLSTLKVTLVWTGPANYDGISTDLDLKVTIGGETRRGNMPAGETTFDRVNNVEQVLWEKLPAGSAQVVVYAYKALTPQNYALVIRVTSGQAG